MDGALDEGIQLTTADELAVRHTSADAATRNARVSGWMLAAAALLMVVVATALLHRGIAIPARRLAEAAKTFGQGGVGPPLSINTNDEIGDLAKAFNDMAVQRQEAEAAIQASREMVFQNERLREFDRLKDEFLATVSHELRTPLTSIVGYVELLGEGTAGPLTEEQKEFIDTMQHDSDRLRHLVEDLLLMAKIDAEKLVLHMSEVDLEAIVGQGVASARRDANQRGIALHYDAQPGVLVLADRLRLQQVLDNIISNALKFTPAGGRIDVRVIGESGQTAIIEVADTGLGVPEGEQPRLFQRFFRSSTAISLAIPGTGIGLSLAKIIVEAHGGTISFRSRPGEGTTFTILLPMEEPALVLVGGSHKY